MSRKLDDWIDSYLQYVQNSEPPKMYHLWSAIAVISSVLKRKCCLEWGSLTFYPNMYIILVGPPAARKGTAMNLARPFLEELQVRMAAEATTREALILALKEATDTTATLDGRMFFHSSLTVWSQELTVFLGHQNFQLMSDMTDWYDCRNQWTYRTKHEGTDEIVGVFVVLYGATTPDLIRTALPIDAIGGGLTSRMIFVYERNKGKVCGYPGFSPEELAIREKLKIDLSRIANLSGKFRTSQQFFDYWMEWYPAQEKNPPFESPHFAGYIERRANHVMKLSMICSAAHSDDKIIEVDDLKRAIGILEETEVKMSQTFSGVGKYQDADVLSKIMTDVGNSKCCMFSELLFRYRNDVDKWRMEKIVESLEASKFLLRVTTDSDIRLVHRESVNKGLIDLNGNPLGGFNGEE